MAEHIPTTRRHFLRVGSAMAATAALPALAATGNVAAIGDQFEPLWNAYLVAWRRWRRGEEGAWDQLNRTTAAIWPLTEQIRGCLGNIYIEPLSPRCLHPKGSAKTSLGPCITTASAL